jgi:hypothetical protein
MKTFLKANYKWVILIGSLIVSGTLAVRDAVHEEEKLLADTTESKRNFARLESLSQASITRLGALDKKLSRVVLTTGDTDYKPPAIDSYIEMQIADENAMAALLRGDLDKLSELLNALHSSHGDLNSELNDCRTQMNNLEHSMSKLTSVPSPESVGGIHISIILFQEQEMTVSLDLWRLRGWIDALANRVDERIEMQIRYYQRVYAVTTWLSYALIALGLSLSVTGQLIGRPDEVPEIKL